MKALISPNENNRIAEVTNIDFPVAEPLYWVDCPPDCVADLWTYANGMFTPPPPVVETVAPTV